MSGKIVRAVLVLVGVAALVACTPKAAPILAIGMRDQRPVVLLYVCAADSKVSIDPTGGVQPGRNTNWSARASSAATGAVVELPVFGATPAGWDLGLNSDTTLRGGVHYQLTGMSHRDARVVNFTLGDLARLGAAQVLAPDGPVARSTSRTGRAAAAPDQGQSHRRAHPPASPTLAAQTI